VAATAQSSDKVSSAILVLRDSFEDGDAQMAEKQEAGFMALISEIRELRRVSYHGDRWLIRG
jgi:hypothetical protein